MNYKGFLRLLLFSGVLFAFISCEDFFEPEPKTVIPESEFFNEFADFRTAEMGLYSLQQQLVDQLVILGELRADLLEPTRNADADLIEISKLTISENNRYISAVNFYKLIANCNNLLNKIEARKPSVKDPASLLTVDNYDRMYGSVLSIRAWAYFNAVRIYGKIPWIPQAITDVRKIEEYINNGIVIVDVIDVVYGPDSYTRNDTVRNDTIDLPVVWLNTEAIIDTFTNQLETKVKKSVGVGGEITLYVGVDYNIDGINDNTWEITVWNRYAYHSLLGQMYLTDGNLYKAEEHFNYIVRFTTSITAQERRYLLGTAIAGGANWRNFYTGLNILEHIFVLDFNKDQRQENGLKNLVSSFGSNKYMIKPTKNAVNQWEGDTWKGVNSLNNAYISVPYWSSEEWTRWNEIYDRSKDPFADDNNYDPSGYWGNSSVGDFGRGHLASYAYVKNGQYLTDGQVAQMLLLKYKQKDKEVLNFMSGVDTVVYKFVHNKPAPEQSFDRDTKFYIYTAPSIHLYMAELLSRARDIGSPLPDKTFRDVSVNIMFDGSYGHRNNFCLGVRRRVGLGKVEPVDNLYFIDPNTSQVIKGRNIGGLAPKIIWFEHKVMDERAKELAFQGERYYDLMRVSLRQGKQNFFDLLTIDEFYRNKPAYYIAFIISQKFKGAERERVFEYLNNPDNWYVPFTLRD
jgi:starch-binding outer membrane protein, SusD/RagB family